MTTIELLKNIKIQLNIIIEQVKLIETVSENLRGDMIKSEKDNLNQLIKEFNRDVKGSILDLSDNNKNK